MRFIVLALAVGVLFYASTGVYGDTCNVFLDIQYSSATPAADMRAWSDYYYNEIALNYEKDQYDDIWKRIWDAARVGKYAVTMEYDKSDELGVWNEPGQTFGTFNQTVYQIYLDFADPLCLQFTVAVSMEECSGDCDSDGVPDPCVYSDWTSAVDPCFIDLLISW